MKLPDTRKSWFDRNMTLQQCNVKCTNECDCMAYATLDIKLDTGCVLWYGDLIDMRTLPNSGQDIFIRISAIELEKDKTAQSKKKVMTITIPVALGLVTAIGLSILLILSKKKKPKRRHQQIVEKHGLDLMMFGLSTLSVATNNFSVNNKLGQGGFGPVYKGVLEDGQEIAVKRLSIGSNQGDEEFKNEVIFISKLQHRNLVKILGYCIEGMEKLLVYEYMPNNSLDFLLFDETKSKQLDWRLRFHILKGIARGLLYLHQDSRLLIIHRHLKAANILLDRDMNPKISDFGLARSFVGTDTATNTNKVVGTYGYMSPEYALDGIFSIKSDVFSFGVLLLEIVSGKKNRGFIQPGHDNNLIGHAWILYNEGKSMELLDANLVESCHPHEVLRSIQVGLLCVQQNAGDRPDMPAVIMMLGGDGTLRKPKQPAFFTERDELFVSTFSSSSHPTCTINELTITDVVPR